MRRTITGRAVARLRRRAPGRAPRSPRRSLILPLLCLGLALLTGFGLGRWTSPATEPAQAASQDALGEPEAEPELSAAETSTLALCPCPRPRRPGPPRLAASVKPIPAAWTNLATRPDPTSATQRYLSSSAPSFQSCAQQSGAPERVHLELRVSPEGTIEKVRVMNLEPIATGLATCVEQQALRLKPPGFDGVAAETFALTLVL